MKEKIKRFIIYILQTLFFEAGRLRILLFHQNECNLMEVGNGRTGRIPGELLKALPRSLRVNNRYLPGKKIEFYSDQDQLEMIVLYRSHRVLGNMSVKGTSGIEITVRNDQGVVWNECIFPGNVMQMYCSHTLKTGGGAYICVSLPPFALVDSIMIDHEAVISRGQEEKDRIAVYGSSITHGCAASRPAFAYTSILENLTGCRVYNFGFSESAKGEKEVIQYIASLGAKIIIIEFDHNASVEELRDRHFDVYRTIRNITDCWIIFMSRFSGGLSISEEEEQERMQIISNTYQAARELHDNKVAWIPGNIVFGADKKEYFVDNVHPNDSGMKIIAETIYDTIQKRGMLN